MTGCILFVYRFRCLQSFPGSLDLDIAGEVFRECFMMLYDCTTQVQVDGRVHAEGTSLEAARSVERRPWVALGSKAL